MVKTTWWWTVWLFYLQCNPEMDSAHSLEMAKLEYHAAVLFREIEPRLSADKERVRFTLERYDHFRRIEEYQERV